MWLYHREMSLNHADGMANSVDAGQTVPLGAVWSGSALFAQAYLSENLDHYCSMFVIFANMFENLMYEPRHEKTCLCHMWTTKAQISLHFRAVWSAPLLFIA